jgi:hypothetical protein
VATITINTDAAIEFKALCQNTSADASPFVIVQVGNWDIDGKQTTGIIVDCSGPDDAPAVLTGDNARKLAKWLTRAADTLDTSSGRSQKKKRTHYEQDDEEYKF